MVLLQIMKCFIDYVIDEIQLNLTLSSFLRVGYFLYCKIRVASVSTTDMTPKLA